jgi:hypothetical protein
MNAGGECGTGGLTTQHRRSQTGSAGIPVAYPGGHAGCDAICARIHEFVLLPNRRQRLPKTPRLAGCGATSPLLFSMLTAAVCQAADQRDKRVEINGLGDMQVEAGIHRRLDIAV